MLPTFGVEKQRIDAVLPLVDPNPAVAEPCRVGMRQEWRKQSTLWGPTAGHHFGGEFFAVAVGGLGRVWGLGHSRHPHVPICLNYFHIGDAAADVMA